jgi:hypothetical protein
MPTARAIGRDAVTSISERTVSRILMVLRISDHHIRVIWPTGATVAHPSAFSRLPSGSGAPSGFGF